MLNQKSIYLENLWKTIIVNNKEFRLYFEDRCDFYHIVYNELSIRIKNLLLKKNFKMFFFKCAPKTDLHLFLDKYYYICSEKNLSEVLKKIRFYQRNDLMYLYLNNVFKVLLTIPAVDKENKYSYNFCMIVDPNFNINKVYNHNFNLINIESVNEINASDISFQKIEEIFNSGILIKNDHLDFKKAKKWSYDYIDYKTFYRGENQFDVDKKSPFSSYCNEDSKISQPLFEQNYYFMSCAEVLGYNLFSMDKFYYKSLNENGWLYDSKEDYKLEATFFTNYYDLSCGTFYDTSTNKCFTPDHFYTSFADDYGENGFHNNSFSEEYVLNGYINFDNLEEIWYKDMYEY